MQGDATEALTGRWVMWSMIKRTSRFQLVEPHDLVDPEQQGDLLFNLRQTKMPWRLVSSMRGLTIPQLNCYAPKFSTTRCQQGFDRKINA
jgi:hypothetical protein